MLNLATKPAAIRALGERVAYLLRTVLAPLPTRTLSEWSDEFRRLSPETSASPGRWRTDALPYLRGILDAMSDPAIETVVVMAASQVGKSEAALCLVGYTIHQNPAPMLVVLPTLELGRSWSTDRFATMCRDTPVLRGCVQEWRSKDARSTMLSHKFPGGSLTIAGSNSAASLSSRPIRTLLLDELDRFATVTEEGDPDALATRRTAAFPGRKIVKVSSPTIKGASRIEAAYEAGDQRRFHVPCPECEHFQPLRWSGVKWEQGQPETARYACEECGALIPEREKLAMLRRGVWVAEHPERPVASFHISALYSPFVRWGEIARDLLDSKGNPEKMQVWTNCQLGEPYEEQGERVLAHQLMDRLEDYGGEGAEVPAGVGLLTAGVDTQGQWLDVSVWGWGHEEESWLIEREILPGDPGKPDVWRDLDAFLRKRYRHVNGALVPIAAAFIDTGGHHAGDVYRFTRERLNRKVFACKGASSFGAPVLSKPSRNNSAKAILYSVGVSTLKQQFFSRLKIEKPGPGYVHLSASCDAELCEQLTGEKLVTRYSKGRPLREWVQTRERVEGLDARNYAQGALHSLGLQTVRKLGKLAARLTAAGDVADAATDTPAPAVEPARAPSIFNQLRRAQSRGRGTGFVGRW